MQDRQRPNGTSCLRGGAGDFQIGTWPSVLKQALRGTSRADLERLMTPTRVTAGRFPRRVTAAMNLPRPRRAPRRPRGAGGTRADSAAAAGCRRSSRLAPRACLSGSLDSKIPRGPVHVTPSLPPIPRAPHFKVLGRAGRAGRCGSPGDAPVALRLRKARAAAHRSAPWKHGRGTDRRACRRNHGGVMVGRRCALYALYNECRVLTWIARSSLRQCPATTSCEPFLKRLSKVHKQFSAHRRLSERRAAVCSIYCSINS